MKSAAIATALLLAAVTATAQTSTRATGGACTTPDPFVAMGGGTCYNGGWLPPGMPVPTNTVPAASGAAGAAGSYGGCTTPDPFVAMGGGTCYNGGWLPPGMVPPGSSAPASVPVSSASSGSSSAPSTTPAASPAGKTLRVLQWNTHHGGVGTDGVYDPSRLATWAASMAPDVIMFNEIEKNDYWGNQDQPALFQSLMEQYTGKTWYYVFAQEYGQWSSNGKGNLILSTYPLNWVDRYELPSNYDRSIAMVNITVNGRSLSFLETHLDPYDSTLRLTQAQEVTSWGANEPENRILAGDMNAWPDQSSIAYYDNYYYDSWVVASNNGTAIAFPGNDGETRSGRIDYIFYSKNAPNLRVLSSQVYDTRDANGIMPSDHRPVVTTFSVN